MENVFTLCQGVSLRSTQDVHSAFSVKGSDISGVLSAQLILKCAVEFIRLVNEPVFFFLELPVEDSQEYEIYYLDNCTKEVASAVLKRFGELLANDGLSRFGFGSNKTDEELYFEDYQGFSAYVKEPEAFAQALEKLGAKRQDSFTSLWDVMSDDNIGCLSAVELDGETVFDIPQALSDAGMYKHNP